MGKRRTIEEQTLSDYWKPPAESDLMEGAGVPVACIASTFEFNADFFETELLPRFLGLRFDHAEDERTFIVEREEALATTSVSVLVDASKFDPGQTTLQWDQLPIQVPGGIQHSKVTLLVWERLVRLIVGSANLTRPGYRRNREVFAALDFYNAPDSVPLSLLDDVLAFVDRIGLWSRSLPSARSRMSETVNQIRTRVRRWLNAPQEFSPRERPRVGYATTISEQETAPARSALKQMMNIWSPRRVRRLTVMTPFVGQQVEGDDPVIQSLRELTLSRDVEGWLIVPGISGSEGAEPSIVPLPGNFGRCWKKRFGRESHVLLVPDYVEGVDKMRRNFHSKGVLIEGDSQDLLMIGSSNFTPHGMGIASFNCEANLVFEDQAQEKRDGVKFEDRLGVPIPWNVSLGIDDVVWQDPEEAPEDASSPRPHLPAFFEWASYSQVSGEIRIGINRKQQEPEDWTVSFLGRSAEQSMSLFSRRSSMAAEAAVSFVLDEEARGVNLTALLVSWVDDDNTRQEGFLAVAVKDRDKDLLPPEEFRSLSVDGIIDCLLSGRTPAEWVQKHGLRRKRTPSGDAAIDSLRAVDTSKYVMYRMRRFGKALAAMADRIARTNLTTEAIRYKLMRDPLGPVHLAETISANTDGGDGGELFAMAEIVLSLGHAGKHLRQTSRRDGSWKSLMPLFQEAIQKIKVLIQQMQRKPGKSHDDLVRYLEAAFIECSSLLTMTEEE